MNGELSSDERNWAMAAHLCGLLWIAGGTGLIFIPFGGLVLFTILGPLIIWRTKGQTMPFVAEQAKESLNFQITVFLLGLLFAILDPCLDRVLFIVDPGRREPDPRDHCGHQSQRRSAVSLSVLPPVGEVAVFWRPIPQSRPR